MAFASLLPSVDDLEDAVPTQRVPRRRSKRIFGLAAASAIAAVGVGAAIYDASAEGQRREVALRTGDAFVRAAAAATQAREDSPSASPLAPAAPADADAQRAPALATSPVLPLPAPTAAPSSAAPSPKAELATPAAPEPAAAAAPAETSDAPAPAPAGDKPAGAALDRATLASVMEGAAAAVARSCALEGGPRGTGRVAVTIAPSGRVTQAVVDGGPFSGTEAGGCVARRFRALVLPPFDDGHVTVYKAFRIP